MRLRFPTGAIPLLLLGPGASLKPAQVGSYLARRRVTNRTSSSSFPEERPDSLPGYRWPTWNLPGLCGSPADSPPVNVRNALRPPAAGSGVFTGRAAGSPAGTEHLRLTGLTPPAHGDRGPGARPGLGNSQLPRPARAEPRPPALWPSCAQRLARPTPKALGPPPGEDRAARARGAAGQVGTRAEERPEDPFPECRAVIPGDWTTFPIVLSARLLSWRSDPFGFIRVLGNIVGEHHSPHVLLEPPDSLHSMWPLQSNAVLAPGSDPDWKNSSNHRL